MKLHLDTTQIRKDLLDAQGHAAARTVLHDDARIEQEADLMDEVLAKEAREFALLNLDRHARRLKEIKVALHRVETGEYGVCIDCEEEISLNRLRAVPWAQRCVRCQEQADKRSAPDWKESESSVQAA